MALPFTAQAEIGVCHDGTGAITILETEALYTFFRDGGTNCRFYSSQKDVLSLTNEIMLSPDNYKALKDFIRNKPRQYLKFNTVTNRIAEMSQSEKDTVDAQLQADQNAAILTRRQQLGTRIANSVAGDFALTDIDTAIDNIQNLADAKVFLKKLVRGVIKLTEGNQ